MAGTARGLLAGIPPAVVCIAQKHEAPAPLAVPVIGSPSVCFLVFNRKPAHFPPTSPGGPEWASLAAHHGDHHRSVHIVSRRDVRGTSCPKG